MIKRIKVIDPKQGNSMVTIDSDENGRYQNMVKVDPALANVLLGNEKNINRSVKKNKVIQFARDMRNGEWRLGDSQICLSVDGLLMNGQHRLLAIIKSNTTQEFSFSYGCTKDIMDKIDNGTTRSLHDVTSIDGSSLKPYAIQMATYLRQQTMQSPIPKTATRTEEKAFAYKYEKYLTEVCNIFRKAGRTPPFPGFNVGSDAGAAFVRAFVYYSNDPVALNRVKELANSLANSEDYLLSKMDNNPKNSAFSLLFDYLCFNKKQDGNGRGSRYRKTENAIQHYVNGYNLKNLKESEQELFLLPCEIEAKKNEKIIPATESEKAMAIKRLKDSMAADAAALAALGV